MNTLSYGADMPSKPVFRLSESLTPKAAATLQAHPAMSGHAGKGGLQKHSVGDEYPYMIVATQAHADAPNQWYVMDTRTGKTGYKRNSYAEAKADLTALKIRNMLHD